MLTLLANLYGKVRAAWPVNRVVTVLTPILFAPAAGYVAVWIPQHASALGLPPIHLTSAEVLGLFIAGGTRALIAAYKWLDGWQRHEQQAAWALDAKDAPPPAPAVVVHNTPPVASVPPPPARAVGAQSMPVGTLVQAPAQAGPAAAAPPVAAAPAAAAPPPQT